MVRNRGYYCLEWNTWTKALQRAREQAVAWKKPYKVYGWSINGRWVWLFRQLTIEEQEKRRAS